MECRINNDACELWFVTPMGTSHQDGIDGGVSSSRCYLSDIFSSHQGVTGVSGTGSTGGLNLIKERAVNLKINTPADLIQWGVNGSFNGSITHCVECNNRFPKYL
jgi:hypothetical protein